MAPLSKKCREYAEQQFRYYRMKYSEENKKTLPPFDPNVSDVLRHQLTAISEMNHLLEEAKWTARSWTKAFIETYARDECASTLEESDIDQIVEEIRELLESKKRIIRNHIFRKKDYYGRAYTQEAQERMFQQASRKIDLIVADSEVIGILKLKVAEMALRSTPKGQPAKMSTHQNDKTEKNYQKLLDQIEQLGDNKNNLRRLVEQINGAGVIPFVGAGLSVPFGFKSWSGFLKDLAKDWGVKSVVDDLLSQWKFEEAAQKLREEMNERAFHDAIEGEFGTHKLQSLNLSDKAVSVLPKLPKGPVITTNYDRVLERVFSLQNSGFEEVVVGARPDLIAEAFQQKKSYLLKIHGDVKDRKERIITLEDYKKYYGIGPTILEGQRYEFDADKSLPSQLFTMCGNRSLLFLGCSLENDRTTQIFSYHIQKNPGFSHYAIIPFPDQDKIPERAKQLSGFGIRPIWIPVKEEEINGKVKQDRYFYLKPLLEYLADCARP